MTPDEQQDLFGGADTDASAPLAHRMRPRNLDEYVGQRHILAEGRLLRRAIEADRVSSLILFGPPGCGKTALAYVIADRTHARFVRLNAVTSNVKELREVIQQAAWRRKGEGLRTILFIDEIHRFNRMQQDALMPSVEDGTVTLIGATTYNPFFSIASALVSRSRVFELKPLAPEDIRDLLRRAVRDSDRGLGGLGVVADDDALEHLVGSANGDARKALSGLELAALTTDPGEDGHRHITLPIAAESVQKRAVVYDQSGDAHYDTASAFIKSMRGSDPDAALYWLAKMITAGEDPTFIARRMVIAAAEDVGLADPQALVVATAALSAAEAIGLPEAQIPLAEAVIYIASAPKSNAAYNAISAAMADIEENPTLPVPEHLAGSNYPGAARLGRGKGYLYPHDYPGHHVAQDYLPEPRRFYEPTDQGFEKEIAERLAHWRGVMEKHGGGGEEKAKLRAQTKKARRALQPDKASRADAAIAKRLFAMDVLKNAKVVMLYASCGGEVDTHGIIRRLLDEGKAVALPVVDGDDTLPCSVKSFDDLAEGAYGILEPQSREPIDTADISVVIAPGVAFDEKCNRLGRGGGHYDRFIASLPEDVPTVALAYELQIVESVPVEPGDRPVDFVVTEKRLLRR